MKKLLSLCVAMALSSLSFLASADQWLTTYPNGYNFPPNEANSVSVMVLNSRDAECAKQIGEADSAPKTYAYSVTISTPTTIGIKCGLPVNRLTNEVYMSQLYTRYVDGYRMSCLASTQAGYPGALSVPMTPNPACLW